MSISRDIVIVQFETDRSVHQFQLLADEYCSSMPFNLLNYCLLVEYPPWINSIWNLYVIARTRWSLDYLCLYITKGLIAENSLKTFSHAIYPLPIENCRKNPCLKHFVRNLIPSRSVYKNSKKNVKIKNE